MNCGNCGCANEYNAKVCVQCKATLALTDHYRAKGFVEQEKKRPQSRFDLNDRGAGSTDPRSNSRGSNPSANGARSRTASAGNTSSGKTGASASHREAPSRGKGSPAGRKPSGNGSPASKAPRKPTTSGTTGNTSKGKGTRKAPARGQEKQSSASTAKKEPAQTNGKVKKIPSSKAYNHTTKTLSLAEKAVKQKNKQNRKKNKKRVWPWILALLILAAGVGIFMGTMQFAHEEDSFTKTAEAFAEALVMDDEEALADYIHPKMYNSLYPLNYENVERCETKIVDYSQEETEALAAELQTQYGLTDPIGTLYRVRVGCTVYGEGTYACTMDVLVGRIGTEIYVLKAENISD